MMDAFNDLLNQLQLYDVPMQERKFTWSNKQPNPVFSKIDRIFLSPSLLTAFQSITLQPGVMVTSDHVPLILNCSQLGIARKAARLEKFWLHYEEFKGISADVFNLRPNPTNSDPVVSFRNKIKKLHGRLATWQQCTFTNSTGYLQNCRLFIAFFDALKELRSLIPLERFVRIKVKERAYELATNEEIKWHHRSRCRWLSAGDRNTRYFHAIASSKAMKKAIAKITHDGQIITTQSQIIRVFFDHYKGLLGSAEQTYPLDVVALYPDVSELMHLDAPFAEAEIYRAVKELPSNKASGLDGLPNEFAIQQWDSIRSHVLQIFSSFFCHQTDLTHINEARIVLLPKNDAPLHVADFRPISVINIVPKIISKVLANRIRPHLDKLVNNHQTAFVKGRFIAENFLATREILHHVHQAASPAVLLKLDFAKAYDMLDWGFLLQVLRAKGFPSRMIRWISNLLSSATSRIEINGHFSTPFNHKHGIRQGDPLSPYLFIIAVDTL